MGPCPVVCTTVCAYCGYNGNNYACTRSKLLER
jgi:hypothetical protein